MSLRTVKAFRLKELAPFANKLKDGASTSGTAVQLPNPFLPHKNPLTGRWAPPKYSLRQQADLVKSAKASNLSHLLPFGPKSPLNADVTQLRPVSTGWWQTAVAWKDSKPPVEKGEEKKDPSLEDEVLKVTPRIKVKQMEGLGALKMYAGRKRMFKGHKWERVQAQRKERTRILLRDMSKRIARYKEVRINLFELRHVERPTGLLSSGTTAASPIHSGRQGVQRLPSYHSRIHLPYNTPNNTTYSRTLVFGKQVCPNIFHRQKYINMVARTKKDHVDSSGTSATVALRLTGLELSESSTSSMYAPRG